MVLPNRPLQRMNASVAALPLASTAERQYRQADQEFGPRWLALTRRPLRVRRGARRRRPAGEWLALTPTAVVPRELRLLPLGGRDGRGPGLSSSPVVAG